MNKLYSLQKAVTCLFAGALILVSGITLQAQTNFGAFQDNNFLNANNWTAGLPGPGNPGTIVGGVTANIGAAYTVNYVLTNFGTIGTTAPVTVSGTLNNFSGSVFNVNAGGALQNNGSIDQRGALNIAAGASFTSSEAGAYSSTGAAVVTNSGTMTIGGTFANLGTIQNNGTLNYAGGNFSNNTTINNTATFNINGATLTNQNGANINNAAGGVVNQATAGVVVNDGTITNDGTFSNNGDITSNGALVNNGLFNNNIGGDITSNFRLINNGTFNNNNQGRILNEFELSNFGAFTNNFFIDNGAQIINGVGGQFINAATGNINNQFGSTLTNSNIFSNIGVINSVGDIVNNAAFVNQGTIQTNTGGGLINNGNFDNNNLLSNFEEILNTGIFNNYAQLQNDQGGVLANDGDFYNRQPARISNDFNFINNRNVYNYGTFENGVRVFNFMLFENNGYLVNIGDFDNMATGTFNNTSTGVIENDRGGVFTNFGTLNNNNEIFNFACSSFVNRGIINNYYWFTNKSIFFQLGVFNELPYHWMNMDGGVIITGAASDEICESITVDLNDQGQASITGTAVAVAAFDTCSALTLTINKFNSLNYTCANVGANVVTLRVADRKGNTVVCNATVTVRDAMSPVITNCPNDVVVLATGTMTVATWTAPNASDNCCLLSLTPDKTPGSTFPIGSTPVTYVATDCNGNSSQCTFNVVVVPQGDCADVLSVRPVSSTNDICGSWCGGAYAFTFGPGNCYTAGNDLIFVEYANGTALLTGSIMKNGARSYLEVNFSGKTTTAPSGSPKYELCVNSGASGWIYYTAFTGTVTLADCQVVNIQRFGPAFQMGIGGNLQDPSLLGASGWISTNGGATHGGDFNFRLGNPLVCQNSLYLEAECANAIGSQWKIVNDQNASGGKVLLPPTTYAYDYPPVNTNDLVTFNVNVTVGGQYRIFARTATPNGDGDSYWVRVNGGNWVKWNKVNHPSYNGYQWDQVGQWDGCDTETPIAFPLNPGTNTIQFTWREPNACLDKIFITLGGKKPTGFGGDAANCGSGNNGSGSCNKSALFVVGNTTLNAGDAAIKARLETNGFSVTVKSGAQSLTSDANGKGIVVISSTVNSTDVNSKFRDVSVPVVTWESYLFDDLAMTGAYESTDYGTISSAQVQIATPSHPLAAGLSGVQNVFTSAAEMSYGKPGNGAVKIANAVNYSSKTLLFGYETGATMVGKTAPARRVGFFAKDASGSIFTAQGFALFDAAVNWALNCNSVAPPPACNKTVLFVVGSTSLTSADAAIKSRLEGLGYTVTLQDDDFCQSADANGKGLIFISSTVNAASVGSKYKDVNVPLISSEGWIFDDMKMTGVTSGTHFGSADNVCKMTIQDGTHPIAQGLGGTQTLLNTGKTVTWGNPGAGASRIGYIPGNPNCVMIFAYDTGASMSGMNAPARRVGFYLNNSTATSQNSTGWLLFDRTVQWASGCNLGVAAAGQEAALELKAVKQDRTVNLYWTNNTGFKNQTFVVERSTDGVHFEPINEFDAYSEEDQSMNLHEDVDFQPVTGENFYRVTVVFLDNTTMQSEVKMVELNDIASFALYPNPASHFTQINLEDWVGKQNVTIRLSDFTGRIVKEIHLEEVIDTYYQLDLPECQTGRYSVMVSAENLRPVTKKLIISK